MICINFDQVMQHLIRVLVVAKNKRRLERSL